MRIALFCLRAGLFSVGDRTAELTGREGAQDEEIAGGMDAAGLAFDGREVAVETFERGVG